RWKCYRRRRSFMKPFSGRRQRFLFFWLARLALFAYAFQLTAVDHWHRDINGVEGVEGSSAHRMHCHADLGSCAEQPGFSGSLAEIKLAPIPPDTAIETAVVSSVSIPSAAFI